jgi:diaminohydroxyphosphoribosylaminopyrimidine deaminase/5-amino-6-(5-phosphoribosylamino)uracil reductase
MQALHAAGVQTTIGVCEAEARRINEGFAKWIQHKRPFVVMKVAMTLDGRIAPPPTCRSSREPYWITGEEARSAVQSLRHQADAIITGVDTVVMDDPLLSDRSGMPRRRPLLRVILDSALRTPVDSRIVRSVQDDVIIFTVSEDAARANELRSRGVRVEVLPTSTDRIPLAAVLDRLGCEGILSVLTETGSRLNTAFMVDELVDRLEIFVSPQIMGSEAVPAFQSIGSPIRLNQLQLERCGEDFALSSLLFDPWQRL